jgi:hypothetical protein
MAPPSPDPVSPAQASAERQSTAPLAERKISQPAGGMLRALPWTVAVCCALGAAWLGQSLVIARADAVASRHRETLTGLTLQSAQQQLEAERILARHRWQDAERHSAELATQLEPTKQELATRTSTRETQNELADLKLTILRSTLSSAPSLAVSLWNPKTQRGILDVQHLPALTAHEDYQLWLIAPPQTSPVDAGVFTVDALSGRARVSFTARQTAATLDPIEALFITRERKGGAPQPAGSIVLQGK